jgi:thiol-disulfide isomerase/thioredoxin
MASTTVSADTVALLFQAPWCEPCKRIKPIYETRIKPMYILNGISCYELNYTSNDTKELMEVLNIEKIPALCVLNLNKQWSPDDDPQGNELNDIITKKQILDAKEIETNSLDLIHLFSTEDDF